jgi:hypothetical protein
MQVERPADISDKTFSQPGHLHITIVQFYQSILFQLLQLRKTKHFKGFPVFILKIGPSLAADVQDILLKLFILVIKKISFGNR